MSFMDKDLLVVTLMVMLKVRLVVDSGHAIGQTNDGGVRLMDWAVGMDESDESLFLEKHRGIQMQ